MFAFVVIKSIGNAKEEELERQRHMNKRVFLAEQQEMVCVMYIVFCWFFGDTNFIKIHRNMAGF